MGSTDGEGPFSAEAIWQQTLFVQIHLRVGTAHLTAHAKTRKLYPSHFKTGNETEIHFLLLMLCSLTGYTKKEGEAAKNLKDSKLPHRHTQATHLVSAAHTSINDI